MAERTPETFIGTRDSAYDKVEVVAEPSAYSVHLNGADNMDIMTYEITVERRNGLDGTKWAVKWMDRVLGKDGEWEWEPSPSNRDDEFMARCRFDSFDEALNLAMDKAPYVKVNGRDAVQANRHVW